MAKAVEIQWNLTPFRSDEFVEKWTPYAARAINFGATGYLMVRQTDDNLIVRQYAFFERKSDWEAYWNSDALVKGRQDVSGLFVVPAVYVWHEILAAGQTSKPTPLTANVGA